MYSWILVREYDTWFLIIKHIGRVTIGIVHRPEWVFTLQYRNGGWNTPPSPQSDLHAYVGGYRNYPGSRIWEQYRHYQGKIKFL